jgi:hypothetical protein
MTAAPITWLTWPVEEDLTVAEYINTCKMPGREINLYQSWWTYTLTNLCLQQVMAEMPANRDLWFKEENSISQ